MPGTTTLAAEVTNVSGHCVWMLIDDEELALPYWSFPGLKRQLFSRSLPCCVRPRTIFIGLI
jgi:hypothetical protein